MTRVSLDTLIDRSVKNMGTGIHPVVKESAIEMIRRAYSEGINVQVSSGYRSAAEQNKLFAQGRRGIPNEPKVTNARGGESNHNYGLAVDYFLVSEDGSVGIWVVNQDWRKVAQIGKALGFEWGGDWKDFVDNPHLEMTGGLSTAQLQAGKRPNLVSRVPKQEERKVRYMEPTSKALLELAEQGLKELTDPNKYERPLSKIWLTKAQKGQLTLDDAAAIAIASIGMERKK
jgi:peptidoglycan LD-endopeptidase CwlK